MTGSFITKMYLYFVVVLCFLPSAQPQTEAIYHRCTDNSQCPDNASCLPYGCRGYVCLCHMGYVVSRTRFSCLTAGNVSDTCDSTVKCLGGVYASCVSGRCECLSIARVTEMNTCVAARSARIAGATCSPSDTCPTHASCTGGTCQCDAGYRQRSSEEYWVNPESREECVELDYSLESCNGVQLSTTTSTTTTSAPTTTTSATTTTPSTTTTPTTTTTTTTTTAPTSTTPPATTTTPTTTTTTTPTTTTTTTTTPSVTTQSSTATTTTTTTTNPTSTAATVKSLLDTCTSPIECPDNASCRPNGCRGVTCLCNIGYVPAPDLTICLKASNISDVCDVNSKCLSPFAYCSNGVCECISFFRKTTLNTCSQMGTKVISEDCSPGIDNCGLFAECRDRKCVCANGYREKNPEEFWAEPDSVVECVQETFSLESCNGVALSTFTTTTTTPTTTTTTSTTTLTATTPSVTTQSITATTTTTTTTNPTSTFATVKSILDTCTSPSECPDNASCRPNGCRGVTCLCNVGYVPAPDLTICLKASNISDGCDINSKCLSPFAYCSNGVCECISFFRKTTLNTCSQMGTKVISEDCSPGIDNCGLFAECRDRKCVCGSGYREKNPEEFWAEPDSVVECVQETFSLDSCSDKTTPQTTTITSMTTTTTTATTTSTATSTTTTPTTTTPTATTPTTSTSTTTTPSTSISTTTTPSTTTAPSKSTSTTTTPSTTTSTTRTPSTSTSTTTTPSPTTSTTTTSSMTTSTPTPPTAAETSPISSTSTPTTVTTPITLTYPTSTTASTTTVGSTTTTASIPATTTVQTTSTETGTATTTALPTIPTTARTPTSINSQQTSTLRTSTQPSTTYTPSTQQSTAYTQTSTSTSALKPTTTPSSKSSTTPEASKLSTADAVTSSSLGFSPDDKKTKSLDTDVRQSTPFVPGDEDSSKVALIASVCTAVVILVVVVVVVAVLCRKRCRYKRRLEVTNDQTVLNTYYDGHCREDPTRPCYMVET